MNCCHGEPDRARPRHVKNVKDMKERQRLSIVPDGKTEEILNVTHIPREDPGPKRKKRHYRDNWQNVNGAMDGW